MRRIIGHFFGRCRKFHHDDSAQGMVFGAISLFMLAACIGLAHNSGVVTSRRIQAQTAADAAAYAGSLVTANIIGDIAWMNDGMAYVYYNLMRYAVDVTVFRTLAEIREHNYWPEDKRSRVYIQPPASHYMLAGADPMFLYQESYRRASEMIPRGESWLEMLSSMEEGLATAGRYLVRDAVANTIIQEGSNIAAVAMLQNDPTGTIFRHRSGAGDIDMVIEHNPDGSPLWSITYNGAPYAEIYRHGPNDWEIIRGGTQSLRITRTNDDSWNLSSSDLVVDIIQHPDGTLEVIASGDQNAHLLCIPVGNNTWAVVGTSDGTNVKYEPFQDGGYKITVGGSTTGVRKSPEGKMQEYTGGRWVDIPGQDSLTVGGEQIPINFSDRIDLPGNASLDFPNRLNIGPINFTIPDRIQFAGTNIWLGEDSVRITAQVGNVGLVIDGDRDDCVVLNDRSTCDPNSAIKRSYHINGVWGHDRIETLEPGRRWVYKWRTVKSIFEREDLARFGHHAVHDAQLATGIENTWTEWFNVGTGSRKNTTSYHVTVPCWNPDDINDEFGPDGFIGDPADGELCPTCNPQHPLIDYDQRFERADGDPVLDKDGDGSSDVRKYGVNTAFFRNNVTEDNSARDFQSIVLDGNVRPLCLTDSIFAHPLVVAVWMRPDEPFLGRQHAPPVEVWRDDSGDLMARRTGDSRWVPFFRNPDWGYFAIATARVGVLDSGSTAYRFTFDDNADLNYDFTFTASDFAQRMEDRDEWLESWHNHYEPVWTARLWSTNEALRSVDMEIAHRQAELEEWEEVSRNFVWRVLAQSSPWFDPNSENMIDPNYFNEPRDAFNRMRGPRSGTFGVGSTTQPELLENVIKH